MADLTTYPIEDGYESKLSQPYDGTSSTIYVDSIPTATLPSGQKVLVTINPGTTYAQTVEVSGRTTGQLTVSSTTVEKANGVNYTTRTHGAKSPIIISDNFAYWEAIANAVNSKSDKASPVFTGSVGLPTYANATARDAAIPSPTQAMMVKTNNVVQHYNSATAQWEDLDVGTPVPNASTTVSGKVEEATLSEQGSQTTTGATGARLFINPVNTAKTSSGASDENKIPLLDVTGKLATGFIPSAPNLIEKNYVLGDTVSARDNLSLLQDGLTYKYFGDGTLTATGMTGSLTASGSVALSSTTIIQYCINTSGLIQVVAGTISGNTITYGTVNSYTPTGWGAYRGTPQLCALSSTSFVLGFGRTTGGGAESISATAYTVSGTTITRGTEVFMTAGSSTGGVQGVGKVSATKFAISYNTSGATFAIIAGSVSGTTITAGSSIVSSLAGDVSYIADDKIAVANGSNVRLYTTSGTVITQGNNFAIGTTYTSFSMRSIGSSLCIYTGTVSTNTEAFILDCSGATPSKGTTVTVLAASTSTDCVANGSNQVCIITGGNKYYFYNYIGTTLTAINNVTKTNSVNKWGIDNLSQQKFVISSTTNGQFVSNMKIYAIGVAKASGTATQTIAVGVNGGEVTGYSGLLPGLQYYSTTTGGLSTSGDFIIGKASSTTTLLVGIPYNGI